MANLTEAERITRLETEMNHVATKADVAAVRTDMAAVRTDMQAVRTDMAHMQTSIIKWMAGHGDRDCSQRRPRRCEPSC